MYKVSDSWFIVLMGVTLFHFVWLIVLVPDTLSVFPWTLLRIFHSFSINALQIGTEAKKTSTSTFLSSWGGLREFILCSLLAKMNRKRRDQVGCFSVSIQDTEKKRIADKVSALAKIMHVKTCTEVYLFHALIYNMLHVIWNLSKWTWKRSTFLLEQ